MNKTHCIQPKLIYTNLALSVFSLAVLVSTLFFPFATDLFNSANIIPIDIFTAEYLNVMHLILFIPLIICIMVSVLLILQVISQFKNLTSESIICARPLMIFNTAVCGLYYLAGVSYSVVLNTKGEIFSCTLSSIPFVLQICTLIAFGFILGFARPKANLKIKKHSDRYRRFEFWVFGAITSTLTFITVLTDIFKVKFIKPEGLNNFTINGIKVLRSYNNYDKGTQLLAFFIICILSITITLTVLSLFSLISRSKLFETITLVQIILSVFSTMIIGLFGQYFEIIQNMNESLILSWVDKQLPFVTLELTYIVDSISIYWFFATVAVVVVAIIRKPYSRCKQAEEISSLNNNETPLEEEKTSPVVEMSSSDPCPSFTLLDNESKEYSKQVSKLSRSQEEFLTLSSIVDHVVDYARESRLHLIYSKETVAAFISGLGVTRLSILRGLSGTGKTSLPKIFSEAVFGRCHIIEIESSWRDKNELLGYYNEFSGIYTPKKFTRSLYSAVLDPKRINIIVLDEMNLSRVEYYFSDFLSLMENEEDSRVLQLVNHPIFNNINGQTTEYLALEKGSSIKMPSNLWFVGTANKDESTYAISDKVFDRAHTINFNSRAPKVPHGDTPLDPLYVSPKTLNRLFENAMEENRFDIDSSTTVRLVEQLLLPYNISFGNRIAKQIEEFVAIYSACMAGKANVQNEALETILLSKVVSKLEYKNIYDKENLAESFDRLGLTRCGSFIRGLDEN